MNRILAGLLLAVPFAAAAAPDDGPMIHPLAPQTEVSGRVEVLYPRCRGCAPIVRVGRGESTRGAGDASWTTIKGDLALDVAAFDGNDVTVKGLAGESATLDAKGFAPGFNESSFVTGTVELAAPDCPPTARCVAKVYIKTADEKILVKDGSKYGLTGLEGAKVILRGDVTRTGSDPTLDVFDDRHILVRGRIDKYMDYRSGPNHIATKDNGGTLLVSGPGWTDRRFNTIWMLGKMTYDRASGQPMLKATMGSKGVPVVAEIDPFPYRGVGNGSNVSRDAGTTGVDATNAVVPGASGAGILRD